MRLKLLHTVVIGAVAALAAWLGLTLLLPQGSEGSMLRWTIAGSVFIWLAFGNLYLHAERGVTTAIYLGLLSPLLGCLLVCPPWSLAVVFSAPLKSLSLGVATSIVVWAVSRRLAAAS